MSHRVTPFAAPCALLAAALLSACGALAPEYKRPAAPVPADFGFKGDAAGAPLATDLAWQSFFADTRLRGLIDTALQNNRDLRIAVLNIEQARAQFEVRRADRLPTVNGVVAASRQSEGPNLYTAGVAVSAYELDLFGRVKNLGDTAFAQSVGAEEARKATHIALVAAVANTWLALLADDELLELTQQTLATRTESLRLTKLKFDNGASSELDFRLAESLAEAARATQAQLQRQRKQDENALGLLLGQALPAELLQRQPGGLAATTLAPDLAAGVPSDVLARRPDIRQAEQQLIAANANIGAARAAFFPRISLTGSFGSASAELSGLLGAGSFGWTFAPQLLMPLFDAGRNQANLATARVARDIAVAQYEKSIQVAFREVADALAGRATLVEQSRAQQAQASAEAVRYKLADLRFRNGAASSLDVLDAQRSVFAAQQAAIQTRLALLQNQVTLYKALGGGWSEVATAR
jgi:outer membrane protein, multidrug efflux system